MSGPARAAHPSESISLPAGELVVDAEWSTPGRSGRGAGEPVSRRLETVRISYAQARKAACDAGLQDARGLAVRGYASAEATP